jgi:hypothetical protein
MRSVHRGGNRSGGIKEAGKQALFVHDSPVLVEGPSDGGILRRI